MILKNYPPVIKRGLMENGSFTVDSLINLSSKPPFMVICELAMFDFRRVTVILPSATEHLSLVQELPKVVPKWPCLHVGAA